MKKRQLGFFNLSSGKLVTPADWQIELKVGDHYRIDQPPIMMGGEVSTGPTVYGVIISDDDVPGPGYFWVKGYSQWCPQGETGLFNICEAAAQITPAEFALAQEAGWPPVGGAVSPAPEQPGSETL